MKLLRIVIAVTMLALAACTSAAAQEPNNTVTLCHIAPGNRDAFGTIHVGQSAVAQHLAHGDTLGECPAPPPTGTGPFIQICERHPNGLFEQEPIHEDDLPRHLAHGDVFPVPKFGCASIPPGTTTTSSSTTSTSTSTTSTTAGPPAPEQFGFTALAPVCINDAPFIEIHFRNTFPNLAGRTGTMSFFDVTGRLIETRPVVYEPGTTVRLIWPGASVDAQGNATDWPGWMQAPNGNWVEDPSDAVLRQGLHLVYEVNPTATGDVTYPPATSACASPENTPAPSAPGTPASLLPHTL